MNDRLGAYKRIDLHDYSSLYLDDAGELAMSAVMRRAVYLKLGANILRFAMIANDESGATEFDDGLARVYALQNITNGDSSPPAALLTSALEPAGVVRLGDHQLMTQSRGRMVIGRAKDATPELHLDETASDYHAQIRIGNLMGNVHIMAYDQTPESTVFIHPSGVASLDQPGMSLHYDKLSGRLDRVTQREQRWLRRE